MSDSEIPLDSLEEEEFEEAEEGYYDDQALDDDEVEEAEPEAEAESEEFLHNLNWDESEIFEPGAVDFEQDLQAEVGTLTSDYPKKSQPDVMGGQLRFHDPILFKVDEILGLGGEDDYEYDEYFLEDVEVPIEEEEEPIEDEAPIEDEVPDEVLQIPDEAYLYQLQSREDCQYIKPKRSEQSLSLKSETSDDFFETNMSIGPQTPNITAKLSIEAMRSGFRLDTPCPPESASKHTQPRMHHCPSIESFLKLGEPIHIQFTILPGPKLFAYETRLDTTIQDIKEEISPICQVPAEFLELRKNHNLVMDHRTLLDIGAKPRKKLKLTVELSKRCPSIYSIKIHQDAIVEKLPSVTRQISIVTKSGQLETINLTIEYEETDKTYLGGYRDKRCGILYYNALTQTSHENQSIRENMEDFSCQTFHDTWKQVQTLKDQYQQTKRPDYYLSEIKDKIIWANSYASTDFLEKKRVTAAITIQKYWRRWLAIRERAERLHALLLRVEWAENIRKGRTEVRLLIRQNELWRQHNPTTMLDVELLYRAVNEWRNKELEYIEMHRWGSDKKAAFAQVAQMELDLLLDLEKAKTKIKSGLKDKLISKAFRKMGDPTRALNRSGNFMSWDTPSKFTARQYAKLHRLLTEPVTNLDERYELLELIYEHIKWHESTMTKYLIDLIRRELALLKMKDQPKLLESARKRLANAFYHICRDPSFNPEARKLQKIPFDSMKLRKNMFQCKSCRKLLSRDQFTIINGVSVSNRCITCTGLYRTSILRSDLNLYRYMLKELRYDEREAKVENSVTYLIDVHDLQFLIEQLWHGQSALSGMDNRYLLRLCRWDRNLPWTPWNCVLLTEEEAVAHVKLENMNTAYQPSFVDKVNVKHQAARIYFARLTALSIPLDPKLIAFCAAAAASKKKKKLAQIQRGITNKK